MGQNKTYIMGIPHYIILLHCKLRSHQSEDNTKKSCQVAQKSVKSPRSLSSHPEVCQVAKKTVKSPRRRSSHPEDGQVAKKTVKMSITNRELFDKARLFQFQNDPRLLTFVLECKSIQIEDDVDALDIDLFLGNFLKLAKKKWKEANSNIGNLERKFGYLGGWLSQIADIPDLNPKPKTRSSKPFFELSKHSKDRSTEELRDSNESSKLVHAAKSALKREGRNDMAFVIGEASKSPSRATKIRHLSGIADSLEKIPKAKVQLPKKISPTDALVLLFHTDQKKEAYNATRLLSKEHEADIWPTYDDIKEVKKSCHPANISYGETAVIVPLAERLRHNDERLVKIYDVRFQGLLKPVPDGGTLDLDSEDKIGFDGSTGNSMFNQAFSLENRDASDESLLSTCLVPLQYRTKTGEVIFTNPKP